MNLLKRISSALNARATTATGVGLTLAAGLVLAPAGGAGLAQAATACKISTYTNASTAKTMYTYAQDAHSAKRINSLRGEDAIPFASVTKIPTSVLATEALGPDFRFVTNVVTDPRKSAAITVVAGGDPTLSSTGRTVYSGAPTVASLAQKVAKYARGKAASVRNITINVRMFKNQYSPDYVRSDRTIGYVSRVSAWQVDGDRKRPTSQTTPRISDSYAHATSAFTKALGRNLGKPAKYFKIKYSTAKLAKKAKHVASVKSQPLAVLVRQTLKPSDNTLANALAFQVALKVTKVASFKQINVAYKKELGRMGVPMSRGMVFKDGSGLSEKNRMQVKFVTNILAKVVNSGQKFQLVRSGLPVAGEKGSTLSSRFIKGYQKIAKGKVQAKTGYISSTTSLAGITKATDGTTVVFASAIRNSKQRWRTRANNLDGLAAAYYACGSTNAR